MPSDIPFARIHFIVAKEANRAVIFKRGPSKWVQLINWNLKTDMLEYGQRFHGRVYEQRSDISPDGEYLIYFASKYGKQQEDSYDTTWTAISRTPCFTALALWPLGHTWYGGGKFLGKNSIWLNHPEGSLPHAKHQPHPALRITTNVNNRYMPAEDVYDDRLIAYGWRMLSGESADVEIWVKESGSYQLRRETIRANFESLHTFYLIEKGKTFLLPNVDYADWDHQGRLLVASEGKLFATQKNRQLYDAGSWKCIADLNGVLPSIGKAPTRFTVW